MRILTNADPVRGRAWMLQLQVATGWTAAPLREVVLAELELAAATAGIELAEVWLKPANQLEGHVGEVIAAAGGIAHKPLVAPSSFVAKMLLSRLSSTRSSLEAEARGRRNSVGRADALSPAGGDGLEMMPADPLGSSIGGGSGGGVGRLPANDDRGGAQVHPHAGVLAPASAEMRGGASHGDLTLLAGLAEWAGEEESGCRDESHSIPRAPKGAHSRPLPRAAIAAGAAGAGESCSRQQHGPGPLAEAADGAELLRTSPAAAAAPNEELGFRLQGWRGDADQRPTSTAALAPLRRIGTLPPFSQQPQCDRAQSLTLNPQQTGSAASSSSPARGGIRSCTSAGSLPMLFAAAAEGRLSEETEAALIAQLRCSENACSAVAAAAAATSSGGRRLPPMSAWTDLGSEDAIRAFLAELRKRKCEERATTPPLRVPQLEDEDA